jgi:hypothetical protein
VTHRRLAASLLGAAVFVGLGAHGVHAAGGFSLDSALGADGDRTAACTEDGVRVGYRLTGTAVGAVTVEGLPEACVGQAVSVTVGRASGHGVETTGTVTGTTTVLALGTPVDATAVTYLTVVIAG